MGFLVIVAVVVVSWGIMIAVGAYVSSQKGRGDAEGVMLALVLGPLGILIAALLPSKVAAPMTVAQRQAAARAHAQFADAQKQAMKRYAAKVEAGKLAAEAEAERQRAERERRRIERRDAYLARGITPGPLAWITATSLTMMAWYKGTSDMMQMLVWAACMALPAALAAVIFFLTR